MRRLSTLAAPAFAFLLAAVLPATAPAAELPAEGSKAADSTL
jgi:peroxiredoxin Q/BCP